MTPQEAKQILKECRHLQRESEELRRSYERYTHRCWRDDRVYRNIVAGLLCKYLQAEKNAVESAERIEATLECLPSLERRILRLHFVSGQTWQKVAEETGYSVEHVKGYLQKRAVALFAAWWSRCSE